MALFIDQTGTPDIAFSNLFTIVSQDLGLGTSTVTGDPTVQQVTYTQDPANTTATATRISDIIADPGTVVISGLPSGTTFVAHLPSGDVSVDITGNGITFVDVNGVVRVAYDTGQCNGQGIWTVGEDGHTHISTPNPVVLYHELSHAFHHLKGTVAGTPAAEEQAAETDENVMRDQLGLPHRLVTDHTGGCGGVGTGNGCLVVTAAYVSPSGVGSTAAVRWLHATRGALLPRFGLGRDVFAAAYAQYLDASAPLALRMRGDDELRDAVRRLLVDPVLRVFAVAAARWQRDAVSGHGAGQLRRPLPPAARGGQPPVALPLARAMSRAIDQALAGADPPHRPGTPDRPETPDQVDLLRPVLASLAAAPLPRWALLEPLDLYWREAATGADLDARLPVAIAQQSAAWLGRAPTLYRDPPARAELLVADLRAVRARLRLTPAERRALTDRLLALYADAVPYDLRAAAEAADDVAGTATGTSEGEA